MAGTLFSERILRSRILVYTINKELEVVRKLRVATQGASHFCLDVFGRILSFRVLVCRWHPRHVTACEGMSRHVKACLGMSRHVEARLHTQRLLDIRVTCAHTHTHTQACAAPHQHSVIAFSDNPKWWCMPPACMGGCAMHTCPWPYVPRGW